MKKLFTIKNWVILSLLTMLQFNSITGFAQTGEALHFDGANDMVTISTTLGNFATSDFTFETWFKTTGTGDMAVVAKRTACSPGNFWNVRIISGRIWFEVQQNASATISLGSPTTTLYNDGAWHHLAVVRRANVYNIYVNGLLVAQEVNASVLNLNNTAALNLGAGPCGSFTGTLDETRLWNIARNSYEILSAYNCEIAGAKPGLLFNYHYNQGIAGGTNTTVTTLTDDSGNNNNGTLTNFALTGAVSNWVAPGGLSTAVACAGIASQSFQLNGNGGQDWSGGNCYTLTTNQTGLYGSIWYKQKIDLSQDFDMSANLNFGNNTNPGADGFTFAFQNVCTSAGVGGGDIGIGGVSPSLVVEFDTYQNTGYSDPSYDHLAIFKNGVLNHSGANQLVAPVQIDPTNVIVTTGNDYLVHILWIASTQTLNVFVNGNLRSSYTGDIVAQIFGGSPYVYWGFTAATGGYSNQHKVCVVNLPANIVSLAAIDTICQGSGYQANIPGYSTYSWSPTTGVSNPAIGNPVLSPATNTTYTLSVTDACSNVQTQSIDIVVNPLPEITASGDTTICAGGQTQLNANGGTTYTWTPAITLSNASISNPIATPASTTTYTVTGTTNACSDTATVTIATLPPPTITTSGNSAICEGGSTEITATQTNGIGYSWSPASGLSSTNVPNPTASPSSTTTYTVTSSNGICSGSESVTVTVIVNPIVELGIDRMLCANQSILLDAGNPGADYLWTPGGQTTQTILVDSLGFGMGTHQFFVVVTTGGICSKTDSVNITFDLCTGTEENNSGVAIRINPNPTSGKITVQIPPQFGQTKTLEIFDCFGKIQLINTDRFLDPDLSSLHSGLYFIVLTNKDNERQVVKLIKE